MIRTLLTVKHFSHEGQLLHKHQDWSKSFLKHFIEGLYLSHAQIAGATPYIATDGDVPGSLTRLVDGYQSPSAGAPYIYPKVNLRVVGPGGGGGLYAPNGGEGAGAPGFPAVLQGTFLPGYNIGIVVGRNNTAVTPTDATLVDRVAHGRNGLVAVAASIDSVLVGDTTDSSYAVNNALIGFIYIPKRSFTLTRADFKVFRSGNPGNVTANVACIGGLTASAAAVDTAPIGTSDVVDANLWGNVSPGAWVTFTFSTPVKLKAGFAYFIYIFPCQVSAGNRVNVRTIAVTPAVGRQIYGTAAASGGAISTGNFQWLYDLWGTAGAEMEHGATDIYGYSVVNPNASFIMRRIFMNNSGEAITVQEAGIYIPLAHYITGLGGFDFNAFVFCAARDIFAGIAVANGESLEVDYTPSITV